MQVAYSCEDENQSPVSSGLSRPILKNIGFLGFFKKLKKSEKLGF